MLTWALKVYETAQAKEKTLNLNFDYQTAMIQGQLVIWKLCLEQAIRIMVSTLLTELNGSKPTDPLHLMDDSDGSLRLLFEKLYYLKHKNRKMYINQFLSWFFSNKRIRKSLYSRKAV